MMKNTLFENHSTALRLVLGVVFWHPWIYPGLFILSPFRTFDRFLSGLCFNSGYYNFTPSGFNVLNLFAEGYLY